MEIAQSPDSLITPDQRLGMAKVECCENSRNRGWNRVRAENYIDLPSSDIKLPGMDHHLLVYHYKALDGVFLHECAGRKTQTVLRDGQLSFIPAGADNRWVFGDGAPSALHIMMHQKLFESVHERDTGGLVGQDLRDDFQVTSQKLEVIAKLFHLELAEGGGSQLYIDSLATALCSQLFVSFSERGFIRYRTSKRDVSLARDCIAAEFRRQITLSELAELCELSQSQLVRSFKRQYGQAPHQYQTRCRIDSAKNVLESDCPVSMAELAFDLGFCDQSHFSRNFKALTGLSPRHFKFRQLT